MKKVEKRIVNDWFKILKYGSSNEFFDYAERVNINSFRVENGVHKILFDNGNYYIVDKEMCETDGEKEKAIIDELIVCGVDFYEM